MKRNIKVSVIMPMFNDEQFVRMSVQSVIDQTEQNWELLIVDDASTDKSRGIVQSFKDERIKLFENEINCGAAHSRNVALKEAKGKYVAFLDADDVWKKDKLERQIRFMEKNGYCFSYTEYLEFHGNEGPFFKVWGPRKVTRRMMLRCGYPGCLTVMYNREKVGDLHVLEEIKKRNDYALWLQASKKEPCYLLREPLACYRVRVNSISHVSKKKLFAAHVLLFERQEGVPRFIARCFALRNVFFIWWKKRLYKRKVKSEVGFSFLSLCLSPRS